MGGFVDLPAGSITAPGALPADAEGQDIELSWARRDFPSVPYHQTAAGSLMAQAMCATVGTRMVGATDVMVDPARFGLLSDDQDLLPEPPFVMFRRFLDAWATDPDLRNSSGVRIDILGPISLALALAAAGLPRPQAADAGRLVAASLASRLLAEFQKVDASIGPASDSDLQPGTHTVAVVMFEPALVGSMHPTFPLTARELRTMIDPVVDHIDRQSGETPVLIGVHVPGRADWQTLITSGISMLCAPPDSALVGCAEWVQSFLANGGWFAWGAVPVDRPLGASEELLWRHLAGTWSDLVAAGVDPGAIGRQCMLGPTSGLERFASAQIPGLLDLLEAMSERVRSEALTTRLRFNSSSPTLLN